jgi:dipeptidyl aminopeptidase/acylaminoacyl peptidase
LPIFGADSREPMESVVRGVVPWLDALSAQPAIKAGEYGFFGHSNAGYIALALEALTTRFKAIAAFSTFPDLGASSFAARPESTTLDCAPQLIQADRFYYEDTSQPYSFGVPFWRNKEAYIRNSPLYRLESATTPLLLLQGEFDVGSRDMEEVYSILHGRGIPVELAYYWGEGHILNSPGNLKDMWERTGRFFKQDLHATVT